MSRLAPRTIVLGVAATLTGCGHCTRWIRSDRSGGFTSIPNFEVFDIAYSAGWPFAETLRLRRSNSSSFGAGTRRISSVSQPIPAAAACDEASLRTRVAEARSRSSTSPADPSLPNNSIRGECSGSKRQRDLRSKSTSCWYATDATPSAATAVLADVSASLLKPRKRRRRNAASEIIVV